MMTDILFGNNLRAKLSANAIPATSVSPDERWSPDILKRIIEGHESTEIFEECNETKEYDERADNLVNELTKYINRYVTTDTELCHDLMTIGEFPRCICSRTLLMSSSKGLTPVKISIEFSGWDL